MFGLGKDNDNEIDFSSLPDPAEMYRATGIESSPSSSVRRLVADPLVGLAKGAAVGIPETAVGLLDIPTMGYAGKVAETVSRGLGLGDFKSANEMFDNLLTPETREAQQKVAEAKGPLLTIATAIQNPSSIVQTVAESIPSMFTGLRAAGAVSKLIGKPLVEAGVKNLPRIAKVGGIAEGVITAGQNTEQTRQQTEEGTLTPSQVGINVLSGILTGMIGVAGGRLAQRFGFEDIDTFLTGWRSGIVGDKEKGMFKKVLMGAFQEGALEELPQSMQEQIAQNLALNKPIDDGVFEAGAMGMLAGFAQSTGANIAGSTMQKMKNELDPINQTIKKIAEETLPGELNAIGGWDNGKLVENITPTAVSETPSRLHPSEIDYGEEIYTPLPTPTEPPPESFSTGLQGIARELNVGQFAPLTAEETGVENKIPVAPEENISAPEQKVGMPAPVKNIIPAPELEKQVAGASEVSRGGEQKADKVHRPVKPENGSSLDDLTNSFGEDIYSKNALEYFGEGNPYDKQSINLIKSLKNKPDADVKIYRTVDKGVKDFNSGDWVTINKNYAVEHGEGIMGGKYDIIEKTVKAKNLISSGDSLHEFGYYPETTETEVAGKPIAKKVEFDSLNPTGKIFTDYSPQERATMTLGENMTTLDKTMGKSPDDVIIVYRGATPDQKEIVAGDFVTTNKQLAKDYAGTGVVIEKKVKLSDIIDDKTEPLGEEYLYRPETTRKSEGKTGKTEDSEKVKKAIKSQLVEYKAELINRLASLTKEKAAAKSTRETNRLERLISTTETELDRYLREKTLPQDRIDSIRLAQTEKSEGGISGKTQKSKPSITNQEQLKQRLAEGKRLAAEKRAEAAGKPIAKSVEAVSTKEPWQTSDLAVKPNIKIESIHALKQSDGKFKLFYRGTRNEVFPGNTFNSATDARNFFSEQKNKALESNQKKITEADPETLNLVLHEMRSELETGTPGGFQGHDENGNPIYAKSGYQEWFSDLVKKYGNKKTSPTGEKESINAKYLVNIINKGLKNDKLTSTQSIIWEDVNKIADHESGKTYAGLVNQFEKIRELQNETRKQLAEEEINAGEIAESKDDLISGASEILESEGYSPEQLESNAAEITSFFDEMSKAGEKRLVDIARENNPDIEISSKPDYLFPPKEKASVVDQAVDQYKKAQIAENKNAGSWDLSAINNYADRIIKPYLKALEKNPFKPENYYKKFLFRNSKDDIVGSARVAARKTGLLDVAFDKQGNTFYALKGTTIPEGLYSEAHVLALDIKYNGLENVPADAWGKPVSKEPSATKQSWEQTREEFVGEATGDERAIRLAAHAQHVKQAIADGERVPLEVLNNYKNNGWAQIAIDKIKSKGDVQTELAGTDSFNLANQAAPRGMGENIKEVIPTGNLFTEGKKKESDIPFNRGGISGLQQFQVQSVIDQALKSIPNPPKVNIIQSNQDCPDAVQKIMEEYEIDDAMGFTHNGEVYLVANNIRNEEEILRTMAHELTHSGLGKFFQRQTQGKIMPVRAEYEALMDAIYRAHTEEVEQLSKTTHTHLNTRTVQGRRQACEEWLCNQSYESQPKWYDKLVAIFNDFLRAVGLNVKLSDAEIRVVLQDAFKEFGDRQIGVRRSQPMFSRSDNPDYKWWEGMDIRKQLESLPFKFWQKPRNFIAEGYVPITRAEADKFYYDGMDIFVARVDLKGAETTGNEGWFMRPRNSFYGYQGYNYDETYYQNKKAKELYQKYSERYSLSERGREDTVQEEMRADTGIQDGLQEVAFSRRVFGDLKPLDYISSYIPDSLSSWFKQTSSNSIPPTDISQTNGTWEIPASSTMNTLNYILADRNIDLRDTVKSIEKTHGILEDQKNTSLKETLFSGRLSSRLDDFVNNELHSVISAMAKNGISIAQIEEYLHARHAEEANDYLDSLPEDKRKGDAGISTEDANDYLDSLDPALKEKYEKIALMLDKITHKNAQLLVKYSLESQETIDKWFNKYKHYVPLFREDIEERPGTGQGFTVAGSASKGRTGSERKVVHILSNIAMQRERTLTRGEKNRVSQSLVSLAENFPNEDFWKIIKIPRLSAFIAPGIEAKIKPNVVVARIKDEETGEIKHIGVQFNENNKRAMRMAAALKNMDMDNIGEILGIIGKITRYVSAINTQYNPVFGVTNFFRDMGTAAFNLSTTTIAGKQKKVLSNVLPAMKGIWQTTRGDESSEMAKLFKDFQLHGGQTGYRNLFVVSQDRAKAIEKELKSLQAGKPRRYLSAFAGILSDYNTMSENSIRLSAYKVGIESGMTKDKAASMAKNLTVNFNKKGQIAGQAGALYAFFNASVQGAVRMYETLKGPMGYKIIAGGIILGAAQAMMLAAAGFKDEEPPEFVKERNVIIPIGDKKYITFPMPLGFNIIPNVGRILAEITLGGGKNAGVKMSGLIGIIIETFNPLGSSGLSIQTVTPTFLDPFVALAENKNWTGRPIYKEDFNSLNPTPGTSRVKDSATVLGRGLAWAFNILTGGNKYTPGLFSPTPDQIDYLSGQITGGLGREIGKTSMMFESLYTGEELPAYKLPLTGRFYGTVEGQANESNKYYSNLKKLNVHEANIKGRIKDREPVNQYIKDNPEAKLWRMANTVENTISRIKKRRELARTPEAKKIYDKLITLQMKRLNDRMEKAGG